MSLFFPPEETELREQSRFSPGTINISSGRQRLFLSQLRLNLSSRRLPPVLPQNSPPPPTLHGGSSEDTERVSHAAFTQGNRSNWSQWSFSHVSPQTDTLQTAFWLVQKLMVQHDKKRKNMLGILSCPNERTDTFQEDD